MESTAFKHFILTRFNVPVDQWKASKDGEKVLSEDWLKHRFSLFETFCLPSVKNQTNQNFTWLVLFDVLTPKHYKHKISIIQNEYAGFQAVYVASYGELIPAIIESIHRGFSNDTTHIITSRLDNDDSLHKDYVDTIQRQFANQSLQIIDVPDGFNLAIESPGRLGKMNAPFNPFISLIEQRSNFGTVLSRQHAHWSEHDHITSIKGKHLWLQVIHQKNMLNTYKGSIQHSYKTLNTDFGIDQKVVDALPKQNILTTTFENLSAAAYLVLKKIKRTLFNNASSMKH